VSRFTTTGPHLLNDLEIALGLAGVNLDVFVVNDGSTYQPC
jgi:hypothetical protein